MFLPDYVKNCIDALERAGFAAYAVGGCVRDACLGLNPHDYDICTAALPEEIQAWLYDNQIEGMDYLFADATAIKTMLRGNPGFM